MNARPGRSGPGRPVLVAALVVMAALGGAVVAAAPAASRLARHVVAGGGGRTMAPGFVLHGTIGQSVSGPAAGPGGRVLAGFWPGHRAASPGPTPTGPTPSPTTAPATPSTVATVTPAATVTPGSAVQWTVNATDDTDDGACNAAHCSLREALNQNLWHIGPDTIRFAIPPGAPGCNASGVCTIRPSRRLPEVLDGQTTIDGFTQVGARANSAPVGQPINAVLRIVLDGSALPESERYAAGLVVLAPDNTIRGLVIHGYQTGIDVIETSGTRIEGNFVGTDASGMAAPGNRCIGISLGWIQGGSGSARNVVGGSAPAARNLISGNGCNGVSVGPSGNNDVLGNYIGTDATGAGALPNVIGGVRVYGSVGNRIGGAGAGDANLVAFNGTAGVIVTQSTDPASANRISRNRIHSSSGPGIVLEGGANGGILPPVIESATIARIAGSACARCVVEVFSDAADEGAIFEGAVTADAAGRWTLDVSGGVSGPHLTATASDDDANTSAFSLPVGLPQPTPGASNTRPPASATSSTPRPTPTGPTPTGPTPTTRSTATPGVTPDATPPDGEWRIRLPWVGRSADVHW